MKFPSNIIAIYKEVHSWVGIMCSLFLFVAFYAGAISMFESNFQDWMTPNLTHTASSSGDGSILLHKVLDNYPEAKKNFTILLDPHTLSPNQLVWPDARTSHNHDLIPYTSAFLDQNNELHFLHHEPSETAFFIDRLHQKIGLPFSHKISMFFMGIVALIYSLALVSGIVAYLPALSRTLFATRLYNGSQKRWLDLHNLLGFFSLPFHIVMALSSVVFAFHEQIFIVQNTMFHDHSPKNNTHIHTPIQPSPLLAPTQIIMCLQREAPGFVPTRLDYTRHTNAPYILRVSGHDNRYSQRGPQGGFVTLDPTTGRILSRDYLPGHQPLEMAILTTFFSLHFGSYGGLPVRWAYALLGLIGAFLFYTGNRLWICVRLRRKHPSRSTHLLACLTDGCTTGCMTGISTLLIGAILQPQNNSTTSLSLTYYGVFLLCNVAAFLLSESWRMPCLLSTTAAANTLLALCVLWKSTPDQPVVTTTALICVALSSSVGLLVAAFRMARKNISASRSV